MAADDPDRGSTGAAACPETSRPQAGVAVAITHESIEAIAECVVELLREQGNGSPEFVDARELAQILGISRSTIYERARELGAIRLGSGARARLRFDVAEATAVLRSRDQLAPRRPGCRQPSSRRRRHRIAKGDLLPIRGERLFSAGRR
jgi:predicted DNA-binding transcriptional regulator AlpA